MFISFEGIDYSGKSTQCRSVEQWLSSEGCEVVVVREPGGTEISEHVRTMLLDLRNHGMDSVTEMLLFSAARSQLVKEKITPLLRAGVIVLADRFHDSTTAYQGFGRGLNRDAIEAVHRLATHGIIPDLTFYFDISYEVSLQRRQASGRSLDRMEQSSEQFFNAVRQGYLALSREQSARFRVLDGTLAPDLLTQKLITMISHHESYSHRVIEKD